MDGGIKLAADCSAQARVRLSIEGATAQLKRAVKMEMVIKRSENVVLKKVSKNPVVIGSAFAFFA